MAAGDTTVGSTPRSTASLYLPYESVHYQGEDSRTGPSTRSMLSHSLKKTDISGPCGFWGASPTRFLVMSILLLAAHVGAQRALKVIAAYTAPALQFWLLLAAALVFCLLMLAIYLGLVRLMERRGAVELSVDELPHPERVRLRTYLNGELIQDASTSEWLFSLPRLLSFLSHIMTLEPGDIVSTGTPAGVGFFRKPPIFLKPGDVVRLEAEGIGVWRIR